MALFGVHSISFIGQQKHLESREVATTIQYVRNEMDISVSIPFSQLHWFLLCLLGMSELPPPALCFIIASLIICMEEYCSPNHLLFPLEFEVDFSPQSNVFCIYLAKLTLRLHTVL